MSNAPKSRTSRRDLLRWGLAAGAVSMIEPCLPFAVAREPKKDDGPLPGKGAAKRLVLLYMAGGASQFETFSPKAAGHPNMGQATPIGSSVEGIQVGSWFPLTAKVMDDVCVVRSVTSREGNHDRGRYLMHTGYVPNPTVVHPGIGSYVSHEVGKKENELPNFVSLGGTQGAGYLGVEADPFVVDNPSQPVANLAPPPGVDQRRRDARLSLLDRLNEEFEKARGDEVVAPHRNMFHRAQRLMDSPKNRAFDVSEEPESVQKLYGQTNFGKACIAARRLLETGVPVVEVVQGGWDTHNNEHDAIKALAEALDPAFSGLLRDLKDRGLLDTTLVYWFTEFGRTPRVNEGGNANGRGHYPQAFSVAFAGGGVRGGRVVGATDDAGVTCTERPVSVQELHATVCHALGIDQDKQYFAGRRPMRVVDNATNPKPVLELFA
jgi:hypothetical protein